MQLFAVTIAIALLNIASAAPRRNLTDLLEFRFKNAIDSCSEVACQHLCVSRVGRKPQCACRKGFKLDTDGRSCTDFDECSQEDNPCQRGNCINTKGSYFCDCKFGFYFDQKLGTCQDIDECTAFPSICGPGECKNKPGIYECICYEGFQLNTHSYFCEPMIYECEDKIHSCRINSLCLDLYGSFSCMETECPNEYYIRENNNECVLHCPYMDFMCANMTTRSIKWVTHSFKWYIPSDAAIYEWRPPLNDIYHPQEYKVTLDTGSTREFILEDVNDKFKRVTNPRPIRGPRSFIMRMNIDVTSQGIFSRNTVVIIVSVSG